MRLPLALAFVLAAGSVLAGGESRAHAEDFATEFDPGDRFAMEVGTRGVGAKLSLRHLVVTDDPTVWWRFEHELVDAHWDGRTLSGAVYAAHYVRHSRDGRIVFPTSPPKRIKVPFDVGADVAVGAVSWRPDDGRLGIEVVHAAPVLEFLRSPSFRTRLTLGPAIAWDVRGALKGEVVTEQLVTPFSAAAVTLHLESADGLWALDFAGSAGTRWSNLRGWKPFAAATLDGERVLVSVNELPLALFAQAAWASDPVVSTAKPGASVDFVWQIGLRVGVGAARH